LAWRTTFSSDGVFEEQGVASRWILPAPPTSHCAAKATDDDILVIGCSPEGARLWASDPCGYSAGEDDEPADIAVSGDRLAVIAGIGTPTGQDYLIVTYEK